MTQNEKQNKTLNHTAAIVPNSLIRRYFQTPRLLFLQEERKGAEFVFTRPMLCSHHMPLKLPCQQSISPRLVLFFFFRISTPNPQHTYSSDLRGICIVDANEISLPPEDGMGKEKKCKSPKVAAKRKTANANS